MISKSLALSAFLLSLELTSAATRITRRKPTIRFRRTPDHSGEKQNRKLTSWDVVVNGVATDTYAIENAETASPTKAPSSTKEPGSNAEALPLETGVDMPTEETDAAGNDSNSTTNATTLSPSKTASSSPSISTSSSPSISTGPSKMPSSIPTISTSPSKMASSSPTTSTSPSKMPTSSPTTSPTKSPKSARPTITHTSSPTKTQKDKKNKDQKAKVLVGFDSVPGISDDLSTNSNPTQPSKKEPKAKRRIKKVEVKKL